MKSAQVTLKWEGPIGVGTMPTEEEQDALKSPRVYVFVQKYPTKTTVYIGQTKNLLERLWAHYKDFLGLHSWVRNGEGSPVYLPHEHNMLTCLNHPVGLMKEVLEDFCRKKLWHAVCDEAWLNPVESTLLSLVERAETYGSEIQIESDNSRKQYFGSLDQITIRMENCPTELCTVFPESEVVGRPNLHNAAR